MLSIFFRATFLFFLLCCSGFYSFAGTPNITATIYNTRPNNDEFLINLEITEDDNTDFASSTKKQYFTIGLSNTNYEFVTSGFNASIAITGGGTSSVPAQPNSTDITSRIFTFAYYMTNTGSTSSTRDKIKIIGLRVKKVSGNPSQDVNLVRVHNDITYDASTQMDADIANSVKDDNKSLARLVPGGSPTLLTLGLSPSSVCTGTNTINFTVQTVPGALGYRLLELVSNTWVPQDITPDGAGKFSISVTSATAATKTYKVVADITKVNNALTCWIEGVEKQLTIGSGTAPDFIKLNSDKVCLDNNKDGSFDFKINNYSSSQTYRLYRRSPGTADLGDIPSNKFTNGVYNHFLDNVSGGDRVYYVTTTANGCPTTSADVTVSVLEKPQITLRVSDPVPISNTDMPRLINGTNGILNYPAGMVFNLSVHPDDVSKAGTALESTSGIYQFNPYNVSVFGPIRIIVNGTLDGCAADPITVTFNVRDGYATIPSFVKPVSKMPICENYPDNKFDLIAYVRNSCGFNPNSPPFTMTATYASGNTTVDESVAMTYTAQENIVEDGIITEYAYLFSINPLRHSNYIVRIKISPTCSNQSLIGYLPINPRRAPFLTGLPVKVSQFTPLCAASHDTISMNANPSNGVYNYYKGKLSDIPSVKFIPQNLGTKLVKLNSSIRAVNPPDGDLSLEKFVPNEVFKRISSSLDSVIVVEYIYPNGAASCPDTTIRVFNFNPATNVTTVFPDKICYGDTLKLKTNYGPGVIQDETSQDGFYWSFGDGFTIKNDTSSRQNYIYKNPGLYQVRFKTYLSTLPANTCNNDILDTIRVGAQPIASFKVYNNFKDKETILNSTSDVIVKSLTDKTNGTDNDEIVKWYWDFGTTPADEHLSTLGGDTVFVYGNVKKDPYEVKLTVTAKYGCEDSKTRSIPIFPVHKSVDGDKYLETFEESRITGWYESGQYKDRDTMSCWKNAIPNDSIIKEYPEGGGDAWVTLESKDTSAAYNPNERSWVESPVFDLKNLSLPMISLNTIVNADPNYDGVTLQYAFCDTSAFGEEKWVTLGTNKLGLNWFNSKLILGLQKDQYLGWTGTSSNDWKLSAYALDEIKDNIKTDNSLVRFRVLLGTNSDNDVEYPYFEGFAFDNFYIGQRNRSVIIEEFCDFENYDDGDITGSTLPFDQNQSIYIQYHTSLFTNNDVITNQNPDESSARSLYYGMGKALPRGVIDGIYYDNSKKLSKWGPDAYLKRSLIVSPFEITLTPIIDNIKDSLIINVSVHKDPLLSPRNLLLHVAVVEQSVKGNNGNEFGNVLRNMIPNAAGTRIDYTETWAFDKTFEKSWKPFFKPNSKYNIIAYIQDEDTKEIYQATKEEVSQSEIESIYDTKSGKNGNSNSISFNEMTIQPNPVSEDLRVLFNGVLNSNYEYTITDGYGRVIVRGSLSSGINAAFIETNDLKSGIYHLTLNGEGRTITQKFAVVK